MNPFPMGTGVKVWLSTGYTDMRCGFPSLALRVQEVLKHDPLICVGLDYVAASLAVLRFPAGCSLGRHIIVPFQMASSNRSRASFGWYRAGWLPATPTLSKPRRIISTSAAA